MVSCALSFLLLRFGGITRLVTLQTNGPSRQWVPGMGVMDNNPEICLNGCKFLLSFLGDVYSRV